MQLKKDKDVLFPPCSRRHRIAARGIWFKKTEIFWALPYPKCMICVKIGAYVGEGKEERMVLVTGGVYQGKLAFARQFMERRLAYAPVVADGRTASFEQMMEADIISQFHFWIRDTMQAGEDPWQDAKRLVDENPSAAILLAQVGCGIVPMDPFERGYRETAGRIGCFLAERAETVYLVNCGAAKQIK